MFRTLWVLLTLALLVGCQPTPTPPPEVEPSAPSMLIPDPVAHSADVWAELKAAEYAKNWEMWPGKKAFYAGPQDPHEALLTTYVSPAALQALNTAEPVPDRAIVVKENYTAERELTSITVMQKLEGYNPEVGDWFWARYQPDGSLVTRDKAGSAVPLAGRVDSCISCHTSRSRDNDFLVTDDHG